jgi:hypothetical protein
MGKKETTQTHYTEKSQMLQMSKHSRAGQTSATKSLSYKTILSKNFWIPSKCQTPTTTKLQKHHTKSQYESLAATYKPNLPQPLKGDQTAHRHQSSFGFKPKILLI